MAAPLDLRAGTAPAPARLTVTVHLTAEAARVPLLAAQFAHALQQLGHHDDVHADVTVDSAPALGVVVPLPRRADRPLRVLRGARRVSWRGAEVELTRLEFDLLLFLAEHPDRVHRRHTLMREVWGTDYVSERTVDVHVRRVRSKVDPDAPLIRTVRGVGYQFDATDLISIEP
ncbi:winged helix-turn-helix domain-containing protein [Actinokineospora bangkokensis]|uniref:OmpR/PhoB-type domain-containing protein n=1 Tax=Actinokineospora bangkokensis TaxID=1193682 RepID=A0A1Q9LBN0_9PSEU|nr:winged helix-turn-helix domain-containing protein [Actinokineospora bangkokensis]OLR89423.1 hypothetical protein BJP25_04865 [Actinokineospora bangkokensis]